MWAYKLAIYYRPVFLEGQSRACTALLGGCWHEGPTYKRLLFLVSKFHRKVQEYEVGTL